MNAVNYAEQVRELFVMSDSFVRIKELIDDESSTIDDIANVILIDPALTGTILKLANSSLFNYPGKIDTVSKAVLVLGITEVYSLVIAYFTKEAFKNLKADAKFLDQFWYQSIDTALLLKYIGGVLKLQNSERLFVLGLLHNLGELVVHQLTPELGYKSNEITNNEFPWEKQQQVLRFTYGDCSSQLLKKWQLPFILIDPVRNQDESNFEYATVDTKLLFIAKRIMLLNYQCNEYELSDLVDEEKMAEFGLSDELVQEGHAFCQKERSTILNVLSPRA